jgi:hypothetical protein
MFVILRIKYSMMKVKVRFTRHVAYAERRRHGKVGDYKLNEKVICDCFQFQFFLLVMSFSNVFDRNHVDGSVGSHEVTLEVLGFPF